tara:strand:+ start:141 stop:563 length:423 start_codon:yes stop_codon:yes gene_type:complete
LIRKISKKDKKDWENFLSSKNKIQNKDLNKSSDYLQRKKTKTIDLHGYSLEDANKTITKFINSCFENQISQIKIITGKGSRSNNTNNPYVSKDLSILKYSVPEFIQSNRNLMNIIKEIDYSDVSNKESGAFNIYLKKFKE